MSASLLVLVGIVLIIIGAWGVISGKIMGGSRGFHTVYYYRKQSPFLYYFFTCGYLLVGAFVLYNAMWRLQ